jgi:putative transposase
MVVDVLGLLLVVMVHAAGIQDRDGAKQVLTALVARFPGLRLIWADGGYAGKLVSWVATVLHRTLVIVKRPQRTQGFRVLQWRWIVERTFGWLHRSRRLSKDFEALPESTETWIRIAMIHLMVRRLAARA